uniref:RBPJ-interacting and tubulin-associated protein 1 n=1 Tax=Bos taurus TaxID=9913 RepID=A0AAA9SIT9_BOVIN
MQGLASRAPLLSLRTTESMKTPVELAISGMQTLHVQHRGRSGYRVKVRPSYVDETLFGSPAGTRPVPPDFDPPWMKKANRSRGVGTGVSQALGANGSCESTSSSGSTPTLTPRKKNKYRLISHTPSYCDESLFGSRQEGAGWEAKWMARGDAAKLHALFWTPPATPRGSHSPRPRETPVRCAHGVTGRGRVSENGAGGQASGETTGFGGAFLGTDRATVGSAPPLTTSGCSLLSPLIQIGGSTLDIPVFSPVMATWHISANSGGVPWEGPPTSSIAPTTLSHRQV